MKLRRLVEDFCPEFSLFSLVLAYTVRKLLEKPASEGIPRKSEKPEVVKPRALRFSSGGRI
jgi:hypothetical protein